MKNYYALIRFDGSSVNGFLALGYEDSETARLGIMQNLTDEINSLNKELELFSDNQWQDKSSFNSKIARVSSFLKSFEEPNSHTLEMVELKGGLTLNSGHWLSISCEDYMGYICNVPRTKTKHEKGYTVSKLT